MDMIKEYIKGKRKAFKKEVNIKHGFVNHCLHLKHSSLQYPFIDHFCWLFFSCHVISDQC